jgi:hypothetical protein
MWKCGKCGEMVESAFDTCWNCGTSKDGVEDPAFVRLAKQVDSPPAEKPEVQARPIACLRCNEQLEHLGTKHFHEGRNWGVLGELGELFVKRDRFDVYACPRCGRVEFFVDGVGEEHRPQ